MGGKGSGRQTELPSVSSSARAVKRKVFKVLTPTDTYLELLSDGEVKYFKRIVESYQQDFKPTTFADLDALTRIATAATLVFRNQTALARGVNAFGEPMTPVLDKEARTAISELERQLSAIRQETGFIRSVESADSPKAYIQNLLTRGKQFGVMREKQLERALVIMMTIVSNVEAFDRSNETERKHLGFESEKDIVDWLRGEFPKFKEIDEYFTENVQRYWTEPSSQ